jgi:hypothetical protein
VFAGVLQEQFVSIFARFLAKIRKNGDVAADDGLQSGTEISDDAALPDDNAADNPIIPHDAVTGNFKPGRHHRRIHASRHLISP